MYFNTTLYGDVDIGTHATTTVPDTGFTEDRQIGICVGIDIARR